MLTENLGSKTEREFNKSQKVKSGEDKNARGEEKIKELEDLGMRGVIFFPTTHSSFILCLPQPTADRKTFDGG